MSPFQMHCIDAVITGVAVLSYQKWHNFHDVDFCPFLGAGGGAKTFGKLVS